MKKLIFALLFVSNAVLAQTPGVTIKPMRCFPVDEAMETLKYEFKEQIIFAGPNDLSDGKIVLAINSETKSWTLLELVVTPAGPSACVLGTGTNYTLMINAI